MAKKKIKEDIKKPDIVIRISAFTIQWVKDNLKLCIAGSAVILAICVGIIVYTVHAKNQAHKLQYMLSQGIQSFMEFNNTGDGTALKKAEDTMNKVLSEKKNKTGIVAKLYLGKIYYIKGKMEDSKKMYKEVQSESKDSVTKMLAENALNFIEKKQ